MKVSRKNNVKKGRKQFFSVNSNISNVKSKNVEPQKQSETEAKKAEGEIIHDKIIKTKRNKFTFETIVISGQIEGHTVLQSNTKTTKYEVLIPQIVEIEESEEIDGLLLILNTVGGDVEAGLAISEIISGMSKPTVSLVLGGGHSIGVPLSVATDHSFIVPTATMTVHPVRISGTVLGSPQTTLMFEKMQGRINEFVCSHSKISKAEFEKLLLARDEMATDIGTVLDGKEAVKIGLIDETGNLKDALNYLENAVKKVRK